MKTILIILLAAGLCFSESYNYSGYLDTSNVTGLSGTAEVQSKTFQLSKGEDMRIIIACDDRSLNGYANDSVQFEWGLQTFTLALDSSGSTVDTAWGTKFAVDSVSSDSFGIVHIGQTSGNGDATITFPTGLGDVDTIHMAGFAVQSRWIVPPWDVFFYVWAKGLTGNIILSEVTLFITVQRRWYVQTRSK